MGQGRNGVGDAVAGALAGHGSAGVSHPKKSEKKRISSWGGEGESQKFGISEGWGNGMARACSRARLVQQVLCPTNQTKKQIFPPKIKTEERGNSL